MASRTFQACVLEDLEPKELFETFCITVPNPGSPPILNHSGNEAQEAILEIVRTNKYISDKALDIQVKAGNIVNALRGLANLLNLEANKCEETDLHLANIERMVRLAETDIDIGYKISRIRLLKFETQQHLEAEEALAVAEIELETIKEDLEQAIKQMKRVQVMKKAINDCIDMGHVILAF